MPVGHLEFRSLGYVRAIVVLRLRVLCLVRRVRCVRRLR